MAPVGNNGPYIPRIDPNELAANKRSLALRDASSTVLSDVTNTRSSQRNGQVDERVTATQVAFDPLAPRANDPSVDSISISPKTRRAMEQRRAQGYQLGKQLNATGFHPNHTPTSQYTAGNWSTQGNQASHLANPNVSVTPAGLYQITAAVPPEANKVAPVRRAAPPRSGLRPLTPISPARTPLTLMR